MFALRPSVWGVLALPYSQRGPVGLLSRVLLGNRPGMPASMAASLPQPGSVPPPPGWYQNPEGPGQRYWDGTQWTEHRIPAEPPQERQPLEIRPAYMANLRVQIALAFASLSALALFFLTIIAWGTTQTGSPSPLDLAASTTTAAKPGIGFVIGPILIVLAIPWLRKGRRPVVQGPVTDLSGPVLLEAPPRSGRERRQWMRMGNLVSFYYGSAFRARIAIVTVLWVVGIVILVGALASLGSEYEIKSGTYIFASLLGVGLVATILSWPFRLREARVQMFR